jgi:hypothetical protein
MPKPPAILPPPSERQVAKIPENGAYPHEPAKPQQEEHDPLRYTPPKRLKLAGLILLCVFLAILAWGLISRLTASHQLAGNTQNAAIPVVGLINPQSNGGPRSLVLPGNVNAFFQAPIYAQVSGYLKQWNYDIGAPVRAGAVLAVVDTPNLDQQLLQAKANLASAMANEQLAASTCWRRMRSVSRTQMRRTPIWPPGWHRWMRRAPMCTDCRRWQPSRRYWRHSTAW